MESVKYIINNLTKSRLVKDWTPKHCLIKLVGLDPFWVPKVSTFSQVHGYSNKWIIDSGCLRHMNEAIKTKELCPLEIIVN